MFNLNLGLSKTANRCLCWGIVVVLALILCVATYFGWQVIRSSGQVPAPAVAFDGKYDKLNWTRVPREKSTGERQRMEGRDQTGTMRELEIEYWDGTTGYRNYDAQGLLIEVKRRLRDGTICQGSLAKDRKSIVSVEVTNNAGFVIRKSEVLGGGVQRFSVYRDNGTLQSQYSLNTTPYIFRTYYSNGRTVHVEAEVGQLRQWLKIHSPDGKVKYEEKVAPDAKYGDAVTYSGTLFDDHGHATHRLISSEGPYSGWYAPFHTVETLNADGTVKSSVAPERDGAGFDAKLRDKTLQDIADTKGLCQKMRNTASIQDQVMETELERVLRD